MTKDTNDPKGWPHPEGRQRRRNPTQPGQRRGTQVEGAAPTLEKGGSLAEQRKPKPTASAGGRETVRRLKANPTKVGKAASRLWTEQEHRPYQRQVTEQADYAQHQIPEARGTAALLWPANKYPTKNQGNNHSSGATEVGQLRKNLNHPEPAANTGSKKDEPKVKRRKKTGARTIQLPEMGVEEEAKASGMCDQASEEIKTRSRRRSHQRVTKNHPNSRKRRWTNRHRKRMTNHEGQPKPPS